MEESRLGKKGAPAHRRRKCVRGPLKYLGEGAAHLDVDQTLGDAEKIKDSQRSFQFLSP